MNCPSDGDLRAQIDDELSSAEAEAVELHLESCPECRRRLAAIADRAKATSIAFAALVSRSDGSEDTAGELPRAAWARFAARVGEERRMEQASTGFLARVFGPGQRLIWAGAGFAVVLVAVISMAPARTWAQRLLALLRVQRIAVLPLDPDIVSGHNANLQAGKLIAQVLSDNVVVTTSPGKPAPAENADAASQLAGFRVRTLTGRRDMPRITVNGEQAFHMTLNRDRLQSVLNEAGRSDVQLPTSIDGAEIAVRVPKTAVVVYGNCPKGANPSGVGGDNGSNQNTADCAALFEAPSPTVSVPPDLNVSQIAEAGLELAGMSHAEAHAFCQTVDWTSTMVIPVPRTGNSFAKVSVDGVQGTLINMPPGVSALRPKPGYTLIWIKDDIIYSLAGLGNPSEAVPLAGTLNY